MVTVDGPSIDMNEDSTLQHSGRPSWEAFHELSVRLPVGCTVKLQKGQLHVSVRCLGGGGRVKIAVLK